MMRKKTSLILGRVIIISFVKCTYPPADIVWTFITVWDIHVLKGTKYLLHNQYSPTKHEIKSSGGGLFAARRLVFWYKPMGHNCNPNFSLLMWLHSY